MTQILQCSTLCQSTIFLCLISSLCLLLCAWFSLIYCYAKYLHDHRWDDFFCYGFNSSFFTAKSLGLYLNSSTQVYLDFLFMVYHYLFETWVCQNITAARDTRGSPCFGRFLQSLLWNAFTMNISREYLHWGSTEKQFFIFRKISCGRFHPAEHSFQNSHFSWLWYRIIGHLKLEGGHKNPQVLRTWWKGFHKVFQWLLRRGFLCPNGSYIPANVPLTSAELQLPAHWLPFHLMSSTAHYPNEKELTS